MIICIFFCSGGKDSCYNMMQCVIEGHQIVALANLRPEKKGMSFSGQNGSNTGARFLSW